MDGGGVNLDERLISGVVQNLALVHCRTEGEMAPNPELLSDDWLATDRIRPPGHQYPVQHRHADGSFSLLGSEATRPQPRPDQRLVTTYCRFY